MLVSLFFKSLRLFTVLVVHEILGWMTSTPRAGLFRVRVGGREVRVKVRDPQVIKLLQESVSNGIEVLVRLKVSNLNGGSIVAEDVRVVHKGMVSPPYEDIDPSVPAIFARRSYLAIRLPKYQKILKVQHTILKSARRFLEEEGFIELLPPVISTASDPGLRGARKLKTVLYGREYELMSSIIMFKQITASALGKVYFIARNVREEPPENAATWRHLVEFTQLDLEQAGASMEDMMRLGERLISRICVDVLSEAGSIVREFNPGLECPTPPFKRITFREAVQLARSLGEHTPDYGELTQKGEEALSKHFSEPFWIVNFPSASRGFYYLRDPQDPRYNRDFNLILPGGFGEVIDGGEREYRYEEILARLNELGEDLSKYSWFLDALKVGLAPSAGFGLGIERLTRYILNLKYVWEATAFPKPPGVTDAP